jgi:Na+/proline symporter
MSTRQLIFVGCKILGIYLLIKSFSQLPGTIQLLKEASEGKLEDDLNRTFLWYGVPVVFELLAALVLFFGTKLVTRFVASEEPTDVASDTSSDLAWAGAFGIGVYFLLTWLPFALCGIAMAFLNQVSPDSNEGPSNSQSWYSESVWPWTIGSALGAVLIYISLRALYGDQPFRWWNGGSDKGTEL